MLELIREISSGRWFQEPSPFVCSVEFNNPKLCVITGDNTSGKSVLRKIIGESLHKENIEYIHISQQGRCSANGLQKLVVYGTEDDESTGYNSVKIISKFLQTAKSRENVFSVMLDEPEIGCSDETESAIGYRIAQEIQNGLSDNLHSLFVITHSRFLAQELLKAKPTYWRLGSSGTLKDWCERKVEPFDLNQLLSKGKENWHKVQAMLKK